MGQTENLLDWYNILHITAKATDGCFKIKIEEGGKNQLQIEWEFDILLFFFSPLVCILKATECIFDILSFNSLHIILQLNLLPIQVP